jgi:MFS family permease
MSRAGTSPEENRLTIRRMLLAAGLSGVPLLATWGGVMWMYNFVDDLTKDPVTGLSMNPEARPLTMIYSSLGAAFGCVVAAVFGDRFGRKPVYALMCLLSMAVLFGFFRLNTGYGQVFLLSAALLGAVTASFYGWLPLYLPELFRTAVRATGQGFGFNFGRIIAAVGALQTGALLKAFDNNYGQACSVAAGVYIVGLVLITLAPETKGKPLPE